MKILGNIVIVLSFLTHSIYGASVEASVNSEEIVIGNSLELTLKANGGKASFPNIQSIGGYGVRGTSSASQYSTSIVNGQSTMVQSTSKIITINPTKAFTIPSYTIKVEGKAYHTKPIKIKVVKANIPKMNGKEQYSFTMKSEKKAFIVGESFLVKLKMSLARSLNVSQIGEYLPPSSDAFLFEEIGKQKQYQVGNFVVIEKDYIVTPQKEGNFTIASSSAKIGVTDTRRRDFFGRYGTKWLAISSNSLNVSINTPPLDSDLVGTFTLNSTLDNLKTKENKPVNLTISIEGEGSLSDFEFPKFEIDGVTVYSKEPKVSTTVSNKKIVSTFSQSFAFIAEEGFTIPKVMLYAYNPKTKRQEEITTKAYNVEVEKSKHSTTSPNLSGVIQSNKTVAKVEPKTITKEIEIKVVDYRFIVGAFILGVLLTLLLQWIISLKSKKTTTKFSEKNALKLLYGQMSRSPEIEEMAKKLYARSKGDKDVKIDKKVLKRMFNELNQ